MGNVSRTSSQANVVRGIREMIAHSQAFQEACGVTTADAARALVHVVVQQVENNREFLRPAAIIETPQSCSYPTAKCGHAIGMCRFWLVKDVPAEYLESESDAWFDFANFADNVALDVSRMLDTRAAPIFGGQLQGSEVTMAGQYTRNQEDTDSDYYLACYAVSFGLR